MTRVLICGGRNFSDGNHLIEELCRLDAERGPFTVVIHGAASGVDQMAGEWADAYPRIVALAYPADWQSHGKAAGPLRNQRMIDEGKPDLVVAFPGGRGTADMVRRGRAAGIEVIEVATP